MRLSAKQTGQMFRLISFPMPPTVKMLAAYAAITDRSVRRNLSELIDRIAKSGKRKSRR